MERNYYFTVERTAAEETPQLVQVSVKFGTNKYAAIYAKPANAAALGDYLSIATVSVKMDGKHPLSENDAVETLARMPADPSLFSLAGFRSYYRGLKDKLSRDSLAAVKSQAVHDIYRYFFNKSDNERR